MPISGGKYVKPNWVNGQSPAINAAELNDMCTILAEALWFAEQTLTDAQKAQVRANIGAMASSYTAPVTSVNGQTGAVSITIPTAASLSALQYISQTLTTAQKTQARANINAETSGAATTAVSEHNSSASAHSTLFNGKMDKPATLPVSGTTINLAGGTYEGQASGLSALTLSASGTVFAHGFIKFGSTVGSKTVTGFAKAEGDEIADAAANELWEFSISTFMQGTTPKRFIIWKNWGSDYQ